MKLRHELQVFACLRHARAHDALLGRTAFQPQRIRGAVSRGWRELGGGAKSREYVVAGFPGLEDPNAEANPVALAARLDLGGEGRDRVVVAVDQARGAHNPEYIQRFEISRATCASA